MPKELTEVDLEVQKLLHGYYPSGASESFTAEQYIRHAIGVFFHGHGGRNWGRCATHPLAALKLAIAHCYNSLGDEAKEYIKQHFVIIEKENDTSVVSLM